MGAFQSYTQLYGKKYMSAAEYQKRLQSFNNNVQYIAAHNSIDATYKVSKFTSREVGMLLAVR